jgi:hypothetical protein
MIDGDAALERVYFSGDLVEILLVVWPPVNKDGIALTLFDALSSAEAMPQQTIAVVFERFQRFNLRPVTLPEAVRRTAVAGEFHLSVTTGR